MQDDHEHDREHPHPRDPHRARPEEGPGDEGFAKGQADEEHPPGEHHGPDFARGQERLPHDEEHHGRFSEGQEAFPDAPDVERDFAEGQEHEEP